MGKYKVQLVQLNNRYGYQVYLPYSVGMLKAYSDQYQNIKTNFTFNEFIYLRDDIDKLVLQVGDADVLGISCYVWNWAISLALARGVKEKHPDCLIVLGGPHVPNNISGFFKSHPFIDMVCHGEGEVTFYELLSTYAKNGELHTIPGSTFYNRSLDRVCSNANRDRLIDINVIPSPYLTGCFDALLDDNTYDWMVTWETNRGCPFQCTFCDWGSSIATKLRRFDDDRLLKEIDYFSKKKVPLVFGADANFGILKRDKEFALRLAERKKQTGYPVQFRVCFTKNTTDRVFELAQIFASAGMNKGVSVSMQSLNADTLDNIKRKNIKMSFFKELQKRYVEAGLVTYTELILPLPGETYDSFLDGIDCLLDSSQHSGLVIYNCTIMPNSEMGEKEYQTQYGLGTVEVPVFQAHSDLEKDEVVEKESVVVSTSTMSRDEWKKSFEFAMVTQGLHLLGLLQVVAIVLRYQFGIRYRDLYEGFLNFGRVRSDSVMGQEIKFLNKILDGVLNGHGFEQVVPDFEEIVWPPEEAFFLRVIENIDQFYNEVKEFMLAEYEVLNQHIGLVNDIVKYQKNVITHYRNDKTFKFELDYNLHEYFTQCRSGVLAGLKKEKSTYQCEVNKDYSNNKKLFSREIVWYGRKGGRFFYNVERL